MEKGQSSYRIEYDVRPNYLHARIYAPSIDRAMAFAVLAEVVLKCADVRQKRLLLERDIPTALQEADALDAIKELVRMSKGMRIALVNKYDDLSEHLQRAVSIGTGLGAQCKYFSDVAEAERWLLA